MVYCSRMAEKISKELFDHLVDLAALELSPEETDYLRRELNNQLTAIDELAAIPIPESTPVASHGIPYTSYTRPQLRADSPQDSRVSGEIMSQVPESDDSYIVVPEIPHEELE